MRIMFTKEEFIQLCNRIEVYKGESQGFYEGYFEGMCDKQSRARDESQLDTSIVLGFKNEGELLEFIDFYNSNGFNANGIRDFIKKFDNYKNGKEN